MGESALNVTLETFSHSSELFGKDMQGFSVLGANASSALGPHDLNNVLPEW